MAPGTNCGTSTGVTLYLEQEQQGQVGFEPATRRTCLQHWSPIALPAVSGARHEPQAASTTNSANTIRLSYQNTDGWRSSRTKRKALGQQFQGLQSTTSSGGYDIAAYAEVHCNGKDDVNKYANDINPAGRSYFTWWLAVCVGPALDDVPIQAYTYGGGRVIRLDMTLEGKPRSYLFVYAPCERADRPQWFTNFAACMPVSREVIIMGDFNTRMSKLDHQHGRAPNAGHEEWGHIRSTYNTHDVWRRRNPTTACWSLHRTSGRTHIDWLEASEAVADELTNVRYLLPAQCCGDHSVVVATQRLRAKDEQPVRRMSPEIAEVGKFMSRVRRMVTNETPKFHRTADKSAAWDELMDGIMDLYDEHVAELRSTKHALLRRLQKKADRAAMTCEVHENDEARRSHAELSLEVERDALNRDAEQQMLREDWGDKPTKRFFQQARGKHQSTTIRALYRYEPGTAPGEKGRINTEVIDTEPTLIATSLSHYWQDIFRNTTGAHTPYSRIVSDYPADMCVPEAAQAAVGADITEEEVRAAIKGLATRRSTEGVVSEVYKAAVAELAPLLAVQLNYAHTQGQLSAGQRYGRITLLFKSGSPLSPDKYRPVAVLSASFKIAALIMTARIDPHMRDITAPTQTGFIKGRFIHENCLRLRDAMHYATTDLAARLNPTREPEYERKSQNGENSRKSRNSSNGPSDGTAPIPDPRRASGADVAVLSTDLRKAYDTVQLAVLYAIATKVGGDGYGSWLRTIYTGLTRSILVCAGSGDHNCCTVLSPPFALQSGVPQGCCHACIAFTIYMEGLAHRIRADKRIKGVVMPDRTVMVDVRYADDCAYTVQAPSFDRLVATIEQWAADTGMSLHEQKSVGQWWGRRRNDPTIWHPAQYGGDAMDGGAGPVDGGLQPGQRLSWLAVGDSVDVLGMKIGYHVTDDDVWGAVARKMHIKLMMWGRVRLSLKGRVMVLKSMAYSQIWYLGGMYDMPIQRAEQLRAIARHFFWKGRMPNGVTPGAEAKAYAVYTGVSDKDLASAVQDGGQDLWDPVHQLEALRAQWVYRMLRAETADAVPWRTLPATWICEDMGTGAALDVLLVADKPLSRSPVCMDAARRATPPWWRARIKAFSRTVQTKECSPPPVTAEEVLAQPLWHNKWLTRPDGSCLVTAWNGCTTGEWQPWAAAGVDRVEDLYQPDENGWSLMRLQQHRDRAAQRARDAGVPGMQVNSIVIVLELAWIRCSFICCDR